MRVLVDGDWVDGYLDPTPEQHDYLIAVTHWVTAGPVDGLYFERPRSVGMVLDYARDIGVPGTVRRIRSRRAEGVRNRRFVGCGIGRVLRAPAGSPAHAPGDPVAFVVPSGPLCADRAAVHERLVREPPPDAPAEEPATVQHTREEAPSRPLVGIGGWSPWSGIDLDAGLTREVSDACVAVLAAARWQGATRLPAPAPSAGTAVARGPAAGRGPDRVRPAAILVGMGNYAKTTILPNVRSSLDVRAIHDIDPLQIGPRRPDDKVSWSTDPHPDLSSVDAVLIAGYHHTHAGLAERALALGKAAVVEKPLATTHEHIEALAEVSWDRQGRLFVCFQRRHTRLNEYALEDLGTAPGQPINYHCVVFEEPLPNGHWYAWPNSGSRLVSNGCHWIDHFLYLNGFSPPAKLAVEAATGDLVNVTAVLENGAVFTMVLTDVGSRRIGVRESIELRAGDVTVRMVDGSRYEAENSRRRLRKTSVPKLAAQRRMYAAIGAAIAAGAPGEDVAHNLLSARMTLDLERELLESDPSASDRADARR